ncbi:RuvC-like resolvase [Microbacterium phage Pickles13]|nr:RuvC-like resolvase [Microbacterium phage Pickles13]
MTVAMGFDLSMTSSGVAVASLYPEFRPYTLAVKSKPAPVDERTPNVKARRLSDIVDDVMRPAVFHRPEVAVVESPVPNRRMKSAMLLERGAIYHGVLMRLDSIRARIFECAPTQRALWATGNGAADKMSVAASMVAEHGIEFETDDECDAFVLAQIGLSLLDPARDTVTYRMDVVAALAAQHKEITK